jgi:phospholipase/carboxylesterase
MTKNDKKDLKTYKFEPVSGAKPQNMVILLHGLGSNGQDLISLAPYFAKSLPDTIFLSPDAPFPCDMAPFGHQWFSLHDRDPAKILAGVKAAHPILAAYIEAQMTAYDLPASKIALVGFSQGTMMSLYTAPRFKGALAGVLGYSGALVGAEGLGEKDIHKLPTQLIHGTADDVVPFSQMEVAEKTLQGHDFPVTTCACHGLGHSIDGDGIDSGAAFLSKALMP